tara:strand:- start:6315 stop:7670 length:1356 start_codon:yes stop_codon:yes gene_type:complete
MWGGNTRDIENGLVDKISLRLSGGIFYARDASQFRAYLNIIANSSLGLFRTAGGRQFNSLIIEDDWLFSGKVSFSLSRRRRGIYRVHASATLNLNPTRFLAHNEEAGEHGFEPSDEMLRRDPALRMDLQGTSLDGNDNYLSEGRYKRTISTQRFDRALRVYLAGVQALLERELSRPFDANPHWSAIQSDPFSEHVDWDVAPYLSFQECVISDTEIYWERWTTDALDAVREMDHIIDPTSKHISRILYPLGNAGQIRRRPNSRTANSLCFTVETGRNGVKLKVYAKQVRRMRLEIAYDGTLAQFLSARVSEYQGINWAEYVFDLLRLARSDARRRIRMFFRVAREDRVAEPVALSTFVDIFRHLSTACDGDEELASEVMTILLSGRGITHPVNGRRRTSVSNDRERRISSAIEVLCRASILQSSPTQSHGGRMRRYVLRPMYRNAIRALVDE